MKDAFPRLVAWIRRTASSPERAWGTGLLAVGVLVATVLEPLWFLRVFTDALPWLVSTILGVTGLQATTALALWAGAFVPAAAFVAVVVGRWLREHGDEHPRVRDRIRLRAIATTAFAAGFFAARAFVFAGSLPGPGGQTLDASMPINEIWVQGHHIHHFFFGFALVAVAGWLALVHRGLDRRWVTALYGVGLGIFIDEIGLLLTWGDYWARSSWLVLAIVLTLLLAATLRSWLEATARSAEPAPARPPVPGPQA